MEQNLNVGTCTIGNNSEIFRNHKKKKKRSRFLELEENSNAEKETENNLNIAEKCMLFDKSEIFQKKQKKKQRQSSCNELEENSNDKHTERKIENNLNVETCTSSNKPEILPKKHKKKKRHSSSLEHEENFSDKYTKQKIKNKLNVETCTSNKIEILPKKHKKRDKCSSSPDEENSNYKQIVQNKENNFDKSEIFQRKKKKIKHSNYHEFEETSVYKQIKKLNKSNLDIDEICTIDKLEMLRKQEKIQRHLNSYDLAENSNNKQKEQKIENNFNLEVQTSFKEPEIFSKKHKKKNSNSLQFEENSSDKPIEHKIENNLNVETRTSFNEFEIFPKKHKKKKKHSNLLQLEENSRDKLIEQKIENNLNLEVQTSFNEPEIFPKKHKKRKKHSNFLELEENSSDTQIEQNKECIFDAPEIFPTKKKKKKKHVNYHELEENYVDKQMEEIKENNLDIDAISFDKQKMLKKQKKIKHLSCSDLEEISSNNHTSQTIEKNLDTETCTSSNKSETFPKKHKKQKKYSADILYSKEMSHSPIICDDNDRTSCYETSDGNDILYLQTKPADKPNRDIENKHLKNSALDTVSGDSNSFLKNEIYALCSSETKNSPCDTIVGHTYFTSEVDCNEAPVDFEIPPLHQSERIHCLTKKQEDDFLASQVPIKKGSFTAAEDKIIRRNFEKFVKEFHVSDSFSLFGIGTGQNNPEILKFLRAKHFYVRLAKDLNDRTLYSIYKRARLILHPYKTSGKLTLNEIEQIKKLHDVHSKKWQLIADTIGNTAERCSEAYRWHSKNIAKGNFTEEEKLQLIEALKRVSGSSDISCKNMKRISWDAVASYVPSRNSSQCRAYWACYLAWSPDSKKEKWDNQCYKKLVQILKEMNVQEASMIDWYKIYESFKDFAPSHIFIQKRWFYIRSTISDYANKTHNEIVNLLCNKYSLSKC